MQEVPGDVSSETRISLLRTDGTRALYQLEPVSGKRHQLRVHMLALGLPWEGDLFYPEALRGLAFTDPVTGAEWVFESQRSLRFWLLRCRWDEAVPAWNGTRRVLYTRARPGYQKVS